MVKKLLFSIAFIATAGIAQSFAQASCTPDLTCLGSATAGICPDSTTGLPTANVGAAYNTNVSVRIPASYTYSGTTYNLTHFVINAVEVDTNNSGSFVPLSALGLTYMGNGTNTPSGGASGVSGLTMTKFCYWTAPSSACVIVSGTPTKMGTFPIRIKSEIRTLVFGTGVWIPAPDNTDYRFIVLGPAGVESIDLTKFEVKQNIPNPFSGKSKVEFTSVNPSDVEFKVFNMLGSVVYSKTMKAEKGINSIDVDASSFSPGIYMYSVKNGDKTITKRMIVSK